VTRKSRPRDDGTLVYSTGPDGARSFDRTGRGTDADGSCSFVDLAPAEQKVRVATENRARCGRTVTVIRGLVHTEPSLRRLARELKRRLGVGGTIEGATIVVQGCHETRLRQLLSEMGYRFALDETRKP
jgi:predicted translation initiation factor SUI1